MSIVLSPRPTTLPRPHGHDFANGDMIAALGDISSFTTADVNRAFHAVLDLPENKKLIEEHTEKLAEQTLASRAAFENIGRLLLLFDSKGTRTKMGTHFRPSPYVGYVAQSQ